MKNIFLKLTLICLSIILNACSKDNTTTNPISSTPINPSDVYICGSKDGSACYWLNNQLVLLNSGTLTNNVATKIIVSNGDVYVLGKGYLNNTYKALFWKNGVLTNLTNQFSTNSYRAIISDMNVVGNDVYFIGYTSVLPFNLNSPSSLVYWKNNVKTVIVNYSTNISSRSRIEIVNNNIYALGRSNMNFQSNQGYYLNGVYNSIPNVDLNTITVNKNNNDVYVSGTIAVDSYYYKNLTDNVSEIIPLSSNDWLKIDFDEYNNKYIEYGKKIFKNGVLFYNGSTFFSSELNSFKCLNDNTYILTSYGSDAVNSGYTSLKINGNNVIQTGINESFYSFFVVQN